MQAHICSPNRLCTPLQKDTPCHQHTIHEHQHTILQVFEVQTPNLLAAAVAEGEAKVIDLKRDLLPTNMLSAVPRRITWEMLDVPTRVALSLARPSPSKST